MGLTHNDYEAFCFDEACGYIRAQIEGGKQPKWKQKYNSFSDMYRGLQVTK